MRIESFRPSCQPSAPGRVFPWRRRRQRWRHYDVSDSYDVLQWYRHACMNALFWRHSAEVSNVTRPRLVLHPAGCQPTTQLVQFRPPPMILWWLLWVRCWYTLAPRTSLRAGQYALCVSTGVLRQHVCGVVRCNVKSILYSCVTPFV